MDKQVQSAIMKEFHVSTLSTSRLLRVLLLISILLQVDMHLAIYWKEHINPELNPLFFLAGIFAPILLLIAWLIIQKYEDIIGISESLIKSTKFGEVLWKDVSYISIETFKGSSIFLRLKKKGKFTITFPQKRELSKTDQQVLQNIVDTVKSLKESGINISTKNQRFFWLIGLYLFAYLAGSLLIALLLYH